MFSNETQCGIPATRFIVSWLKVGGALKLGKDYDDFEEWLKTLIIDDKNLSDEDVYHILELARCGKMEFQNSARRFIKQLSSK